MSELIFQNRQRLQRLDMDRLKEITRTVLEELQPSPGYSLGVHLVAPNEMALVNETFLNHTGSTDVITFDHRAGGGEPLHGELYICVGDAMEQAREFKTHWAEEVVRYIVHGILHLNGYDDLTPPERRKMKRRENLLMKKLGEQYALKRLAVKKG
ncbi:MAG TPA: rRNA maturation RNase YbeY [Roseimicrobium sp.]|nr:rRNA maturation RNase YbeY [Roseimicrobium sp.]